MTIRLLNIAKIKHETCVLVRLTHKNLTCVVVNVCSPCDDIRAEAHHECADERADLLGGPQPPPLLLIQAFLSHAAKAQRHHYRPRRHDQRQADVMQPSTEETCGNDARMEAVNCAAVISEDYRGYISHCTDINYANGEAIQSLIIGLDQDGDAEHKEVLADLHET